MENKTHWLSSPNKNYLGHWDLPENEDLILTIKSAGFEEVINPTVRENHPDRIKLKKVIHWVEKGYKPLIVNQKNSMAIYKSTSTRYIEDSIGKKLQLYIGQDRSPQSRDLVDCVRVRHKITKKATSKESLSDARLNDAIKAIKSGKFTVDAFKAKYSLTDAQINKLDNECK
jgi:hypothetical protein